jgi:pimeloyl-ACP methyl ester carboxylesterase
MDMRVFARLARDMRDHSAVDVLPTITVPTLVVGGARDKFAPPWIAEVMHERIRDSELLMLVEGSHAAPIEQPRLVERALLRTLARVDAAYRERDERDEQRDAARP